MQIISTFVHTVVQLLHNLLLLLPDPPYIFDRFRPLSHHMLVQSIPLSRQYVLMVLEILLEFRFEGMLVILELYSEQLALQLVITLIGQIL